MYYTIKENEAIMGRRNKDEIINEIIKALKDKELSVNEIAKKVKANWSTTNNILNLLKTLNVVEETVTTPKIRLFKLKKKSE